MENTKMRYFTKVTTNANHELFLWLNKKPIRWAVLMNITARVASQEQVTTGLAKGEFFISETECEKFGLKKSQQGILRRTIMELARMKFIEKIESKTGNRNCSVYRFIDSNFIDCSRSSGEQNREQIENKQRTNREQIETNKECKNEKNNIYIPEREKEIQILVKQYKININNGTVLTDKAKKHINARYEKFTDEQLHHAVIKFFFNTWRMENNADKGLAWFFGSDEQISKFLSLKNDRKAFYINRAGEKCTYDELFDNK